MAGYGTTREERAFYDADVYVLEDSSAQSSARIVPGHGNNLLSFRVRLAGREIETILPPPPSPTPPRPFLFGNAFLFPFPNRIRDGRFAWRGRTYQLDQGWRGHHIHGLVGGSEWQVVQTDATAEGARLTCELRSDRHPDIVRQYPFPFVLTATYTLRASTLTLDVVVRNEGEEVMPMGFGVHPYFRMPLLEEGSRAACEVFVPAGRRWELDADLIATGRTLPIEGEKDFRHPHPIGSTRLDDIFTDLEFSHDTTAGWVYDPAANVTLSVGFGQEFRELVVYAPLDRPTICFEPYTCPTNAINLSAADCPAGVIALEPGATWTGRLWLEAREGRP